MTGDSYVWADVGGQLVSRRRSEFEWSNFQDGPAIRIYPQGGLKLIRFSGYDSWTSILPGLVGIVGFVSNKLFFRGRWVVEVRQSASSETVDEDVTRFVVRNRAAADDCVTDATVWFRAHRTLAGFVPGSAGKG